MRRTLYTTQDVSRVTGDSGNFSGRINDICQRYETMIISVNPVWSFKESERSRIAELILAQKLKARGAPEIAMMFDNVQHELGDSAAAIKIRKLSMTEKVALMESLTAMRYLSNSL